MSTQRAGGSYSNGRGGGGSGRYPSQGMPMTTSAAAWVPPYPTGGAAGVGLAGPPPYPMNGQPSGVPPSPQGLNPWQQPYGMQPQQHMYHPAAYGGMTMHGPSQHQPGAYMQQQAQSGALMGGGGVGGSPMMQMHHHQHHLHGGPTVGGAPSAAAPMQLAQIDPARLCKAVAKVAKPCPPWCLGASTSLTLSQEMRDFARFSLLRPAERQATERLAQEVATCAQSVWPRATLAPVALTAVGLHPSGVASQYAVVFDHQQLSPGDEERLHNTFLAAGVEARPIGVDPRGSSLWAIGSRDRDANLILRTGPGCKEAAEAGQEFARYFGTMNDCDAALLGIDAVMRQSKFLSDTEFKDHISSEALMVMLLAIVNSYDPSDTEPRTAQRITQDFFLTYGFEQNCDPANRSITHLGMQADVGRLHVGDELSVLDVTGGSSPANLSRGLTSNSLKVLIALFHYCFSVISNFVKEQDVAKRRAQSALSTVLGGESYWERLIQLYRMDEQPFTTFIRTKEPQIVQAALESANEGLHHGGGHRGGGGGHRAHRRFN